MNVPYPVVEQRTLTPVAPRRLFGPKRTRTLAEIPSGSANHRLVYRISGEYVLDNAALPLDSPEVIAASHVSLVDVAQNVEVVVELEIPSKDAGMFTLRVTFVCSVNDAAAVVREGSPDLRAALRGYLKGHHRLFELGLDFSLAEINRARLKLNAQVKAFTTINPPVFVGVSADLASVELLTPEEISALHKSLREQENQHTLQNDETKYKHYDEVRTQRHTLDLDATQRDFERYQYQKQQEVVESDPDSALILALSQREISAKDFADEIIRREGERLEASRAETRDNREWDREDSRERRAWEQETTRHKWEVEREDHQESRRLHAQRMALKREDERRLEEWDREDKNRQLEAEVTLIKELVQRGALDTANLRLEGVVNKYLRDDRVGRTMGELPSKPDQPTDEDRGDDIEVREEDAD
ncbi:hypothetical protein [Amycolatopsis sp. TNS106]|uniref:hypothetical protein n=1 Tax=Amycolatopsis sp. TNS106 TaxID=2861750 RepID=UPI001C56D975|nr:hypothetical protein [Amycolatopsis sp. TNS106]QXV60309.1 hypothetical protein CVV72_27105 [Amycolatopsis sp. TNS106]